MVAVLVIISRLLRRGTLQAGVEAPREASFRTHPHSYPVKRTVLFEIQFNEPIYFATALSFITRTHLEFKVIR